MDRSRNRGAGGALVAGQAVLTASRFLRRGLGAPVRKARAGALPLDLAAALVGGALDHSIPAMQHRLEAGDRLGRVGGNLSSEVEGRVLGAGGGGNPGDQAPPQRPRGRGGGGGGEGGVGGGQAAERGDPRGGAPGSAR